MVTSVIDKIYNCETSLIGNFAKIPFLNAFYRNTKIIELIDTNLLISIWQKKQRLYCHIKTM